MNRAARKRGRDDDGSDGEGADMEDDDFEDIGEADDVDEVGADGEKVRKLRDLSIGGLEAWRRPALPADIDKHNLAIQNIDADYTTTMKAELGGRTPVIRFYGVTMGGNSVVLYIHGVLPYFYIPAWPDLSQRDMELFGETLNRELAESGRERNLTRFVLGIEVVKRTSLWGFQFGESHNFLKITVAIPGLVATARRILEKGINLGTYGRREFTTYESNIPFVLRYMIDKDIGGGTWLEVPVGKFTIRTPNRKETHCQLEADVNSSDIISHDPVGEWLRIAPLRILSFDIECAGRKGVFPQPEHDSVIQIANVVKVYGQEKVVAQNVFTLGTCASIVGSQVVACNNEKDLLMQWRDFFLTVDCDVVTGYNVVNFDLPYLLDRARALKLDKFPYFGRIVGAESKIKNTTFQSKAYGVRENKDIKIEGRIQFDLLMVIRRDYKLRSYTLNSVCAEFLKEQKEDVHYSIITDLQNGTDETRRRLAVYCIKDAQLPMRLLEKLMLMVNYIEMARVTGVPITYLLTRGQQIKVVSQLHRKARSRGFVIPVREKQGAEDKFEGATVIEPIRGYYTDPIATLDFASLYPSIMMAHNLCYTTLLGAKQVAKLSPEQYYKTPTGDCFVKSDLVRGLLPEILTELLQARKRAKQMMAEAKDEWTQAVLNGRQLALKISANSVYGFTGAQVGQLPCLPISSSVTAYGRDMIEHTKKCVERKYTIANGYSHDAVVIYGDTDSVMVKFGVTSVEESMKLGAEAAKELTKEFIQPIKLEFEKVYFPYLLMNKKRYAGLYWSKPDTWDKMDTKGIETVRRDNSPLVKRVVENCLHQILVERSVEGALEYTKGLISDLLCNRLDLSLLVISKSLGKSASAEDYTARQAHVELAERMRKRDPNSAPVVGDRVAYVITRKAKGAPAYEKAEDPIYVLEHDIPIDTQYYLENQLSGPLTRIFEPILGETKVKSLFSGDHTRHIKVSTPSISGTSAGIMKFAVKQETCIGCKVPLSSHEKTVCEHCRENQAQLYIQQVEKIRGFEELYSRVWTQCQRCQQSLHQDVLCTSRDCPIFYRRKKVQKDLQEAQNALDRFSF